MARRRTRKAKASVSARLALMKPREDKGPREIGHERRVFDEKEEREVALVTLGSAAVQNSKARRYFKTHLGAVKRLAHPTLVPIHDGGTDDGDGNAYLVEESVEGRTARELIKSGELLAPEATLQVGVDVLNGLAHAHHHWLVHGSISSDNVLIVETPQGPRGRLIDYGFARVVCEEKSTQFGLVRANTDYAAPEVIKGEAVDPRADVYSLGTLLQELLTGKHPVPSPRRTALLRRLNETASPLPEGTFADAGLDAAVRDALARAQQKNPARRFPSARAFALALRPSEAPEDEGTWAWPEALPEGGPCAGGQATIPPLAERKWDRKASDLPFRCPVSGESYSGKEFWDARSLTSKPCRHRGRPKPSDEGPADVVIDLPAASSAAPVTAEAKEPPAEAAQVEAEAKAKAEAEAAEKAQAEAEEQAKADAAAQAYREATEEAETAAKARREERAKKKAERLAKKKAEREARARKRSKSGGKEPEAEAGQGGADQGQEPAAAPAELVAAADSQAAATAEPAAEDDKPSGGRAMQRERRDTLRALLSRDSAMDWIAVSKGREEPAKPAEEEPAQAAQAAQAADETPADTPAKPRPSKRASEEERGKVEDALIGAWEESIRKDHEAGETRKERRSAGESSQDAASEERPVPTHVAPSYGESAPTKSSSDTTWKLVVAALAIVLVVGVVQWREEKRAFTKLSEAADELRDQLNEAQNSYETLFEQKGRVDRTLATRIEELGQARGANEALTGEKQALEHRKGELETELAQVNQTLDQTRVELRSASEARDANAQALAAEQAALKLAETSIAQKTEELARAAQALKDAAAERVRLEGELGTRTGELATARQDLAAVRAELAEARRKHQAEAAALADRRAALERDLSATRDELQAAQQAAAGQLATSARVEAELREALAQAAREMGLLESESQLLDGWLREALQREQDLAAALAERPPAPEQVHLRFRQLEPDGSSQVSEAPQVGGVAPVSSRALLLTELAAARPLLEEARAGGRVLAVHLRLEGAPEAFELRAARFVPAGPISAGEGEALSVAPAADDGLLRFWITPAQAARLLEGEADPVEALGLILGASQPGEPVRLLEARLVATPIPTELRLHFGLPQDE